LEVVHPIEHLRYLARADSGDAAMLVRETAMALGGLRGDPANMVVASRRIIERHPTIGPLWWLCAHLLVADDPRARACELAEAVGDDPTPDTLAEQLPAGATVLTGGSPIAAVPAFAERDDVTVVVLCGNDESWRYFRRLARFGVAVETIDLAELSRGAAAQADVVVVGAAAGCEQRVLAGHDAAAVAAAGAAARLPVWLLAGVGAVLPRRYVEAIALAAPDELTELDVDCVARVFGPAGASADVRAALRPTAPFAPELLRAVAAR